MIFDELLEHLEKKNLIIINMDFGKIVLSKISRQLVDCRSVVAKKINTCSDFRFEKVRLTEI
jgi:hypothetical protein